MNHFIIDEDQMKRLTHMARRLYTENRMDGDTMRDFAQYLDNIVQTCRELPAYPGGLPKLNTTE